MLFCGEMRRSSIWLLIACLWLITFFTAIARRQGREAWLQAVVAAIFLVVWLVHRSREKKTGTRRQLR
jgi:hypothetical protein